jgi:hypothetical protein
VAKGWDHPAGSGLRHITRPVKPEVIVLVEPLTKPIVAQARRSRQRSAQQ